MVRAACQSLVLVDALERLDLKFPSIEGDALAQLKKIREALAAQLPAGGGDRKR